MDESKIGFYMIDLDHNVTYVNPAFVRLFDVPEPKDLINREFLPEQFWVEPEERSQFLDDLSNEFVKSRELQLKTYNGKKIYIAILSSFTIGIHGEVNGYQGIIYDITEKKEFSELKEAEKKQNELIQRIGKINKELNDFAYIVSHDLKAPLRGIKTITEWIIEDYTDKLDENGKKNLDLLTSQVDHMYNLIDGILKYSRAVNVKGEKEKIDLNDLVPTIVDMVSVPDNIKLVIEDNLPVVTYNHTQITQVFQNLLSNAVNYMDKPEGEIKVGCVEEAEMWKFSVSDNGPGIAEKYHEKVFEIFQTLKKQREFESTGVGLTLVKKIVESCGGTVWIESEPGQGSTFFFTVPKQNSTFVDEVLETAMIA
jgi:PAS domain S-box-containing protein